MKTKFFLKIKPDLRENKLSKKRNTQGTIKFEQKVKRVVARRRQKAPTKSCNIKIKMWKQKKTHRLWSLPDDPLNFWAIEGKMRANLFRKRSWESIFVNEEFCDKLVDKKVNWWPVKTGNFGAKMPEKCISQNIYGFVATKLINSAWKMLFFSFVGKIVRHSLVTKK